VARVGASGSGGPVITTSTLPSLIAASRAAAAAINMAAGDLT
jgi:hypothetical protein